MSRSNPSENGLPNPSTRWHEWNGETGTVRYYDKDAKKNVDVGSDFTFLLLDELACVRGWHDASESGIYSNEVKDTRKHVLVVKAFKLSVVLAEGLYKDIKDRVNAIGGQFVANLYVAFKGEDGQLAIGSLRFKGAALGEWMSFRKNHRAELYKKAIRINGFTEGKKGRIVFRVPMLKVAELSEETNAQATALDTELQEFLSGYFKRNTVDRVWRVEPTEPDGYAGDDPPFEDDVPDIQTAPPLDDIPF